MDWCHTPITQMIPERFQPQSFPAVAKAAAPLWLGGASSPAERLGLSLPAVRTRENKHILCGHAGRPPARAAMKQASASPRGQPFGFHCTRPRWSLDASVAGKDGQPYGAARFGLASWFPCACTDHASIAGTNGQPNGTARLGWPRGPHVPAPIMRPSRYRRPARRSGALWVVLAASLAASCAPWHTIVSRAGIFAWHSLGASSASRYPMCLHRSCVRRGTDGQPNGGAARLGWTRGFSCGLLCALAHGC